MSDLPDEGGWIAVEETGDERRAHRIADLLGSVGLAVRTGRRADPSRPPRIAVEVPLEQLDEALAALEPLDDEDDERPAGGEDHGG